MNKIIKILGLSVVVLFGLFFTTFILMYLGVHVTRYLNDTYDYLGLFKDRTCVLDGKLGSSLCSNDYSDPDQIKLTLLIYYIFSLLISSLIIYFKNKETKNA